MKSTKKKTRKKVVRETSGMKRVGEVHGTLACELLSSIFLPPIFLPTVPCALHEWLRLLSLTSTRIELDGVHFVIVRLLKRIWQKNRGQKNEARRELENALLTPGLLVWPTFFFSCRFFVPFVYFVVPLLPSFLLLRTVKTSLSVVEF